MIRGADRLRLPALAALAVAAAARIASAAPSPTVDSIVADYVTARGGLEKLRSIETLRQRGRAIGSGGREGRVMREWKRPGKTRFEFTVQGVTGVYASDGARGWQVSPFDGDMSPKPLPEEAFTDAMEQADIEGPLVDWKRKGHQVELVGHEIVSGRDAFKLKLTLKSGATRYDSLDVTTHQLVRTDSVRQVRGRPVQIQTTFANHKKSGGVLFPRVVEVVAVARPQKLRVVVDDIEVNPPLSDARFEMPVPAP